MRTRIISTSNLEPVSLASAKSFSRARSGTIEDDLFKTWITTARLHAEKFAGISIIPTIRVATLRTVSLRPNVYGPDSQIDHDRIGQHLLLPYGPVTDVISIDVVRPDGHRTPFSNYRFDKNSGVIYWTSGAPTSSDGSKIDVQYSAGFSTEGLPVTSGLTTEDAGGHLSNSVHSSLQVDIPDPQNVAVGSSGTEATCEVPSDIKTAIHLMVSDLYEFRGDEDGTIPARAKQYLMHYRRIRAAG